MTAISYDVNTVQRGVLIFCESYINLSFTFYLVLNFNVENRAMGFPRAPNFSAHENFVLDLAEKYEATNGNKKG